MFAKYHARQRRQLKTLKEPVKLNQKPRSDMLKRRVSLKKTRQVCEALAQLLSSGSEINAALELVANNTAPDIQSQLAGVSTAINEGNSLSDALSECPGLFTSAHIEIVRAAEKLGHPGTSFYAIAVQLERTVSFRDRMFKAIMYPVLITLFAIAVLPLSQLVSGDWVAYLMEVTGRSAYVIVGAFAIVWGIPWLFNQTSLGGTIRRLAWRMPWPLSIYRAGARGLFCGVLAHNFEAGLNTEQSIHGASAATGDASLGVRAKKAMVLIKSGEQLSVALTTEGLVTRDDRLILAAGEASGSLSSALRTISQQHGQAFERGTRVFLGLLGFVVTGLALVFVGFEIYQTYQKLFAFQDSIHNSLEQMDGLDSLLRGR